MVPLYYWEGHHAKSCLNSAYLDKSINYALQKQGDVEDVKRPKSRVAFGVLTQVKKYRPPYLNI